MNREMAARIADAVLYEGYLLYPYRPSALKNRQRWTFGILYPPAYPEVDRGTERSGMHSECLLRLKGTGSLHVQLRFLHLVVVRSVAQSAGHGFAPPSPLALGDDLNGIWDEGVERSVEFEFRLGAGSSERFPFVFPDSSKTRFLPDTGNAIMGGLQREQQELSGIVTVNCRELRDRVLKLSLDISNSTFLAPDVLDRNSALCRSLISAHAILTLQEGEFVSLLDPPEDLRDEVGQCRNVGNFPVLVGEEGQRDMMLCSPIVLYDYPRIAPESAGDFFDATEMDEMLTLRVMTLTEQERDEIRRADNHARTLLERTEQSAREQLMRTHGAIRSLRPLIERP